MRVSNVIASNTTFATLAEPVLCCLAGHGSCDHPQVAEDQVDVCSFCFLKLSVC